MAEKRTLTWEDVVNLDFDAYYAAKKLRKDRPWVYDIIRVLWARPNGLSNQQLYRAVWELRYPTNLPMPKEEEATIRSAINRHSSQSSRWTGKPGDDLFFSPAGRGTWAVHLNKAAAWLKAHELPDA